MENKSEIEKIITDILKPELKEIEKTLKRRFANNMIETINLDLTAERSPVRFQIFSANEPINKIEVLGVGGGLRLWLNQNSRGVECSVGMVIEDVEIHVLEYQVDSGIASIMVYGRMN